MNWVQASWPTLVTLCTPHVVRSGISRRHLKAIVHAARAEDSAACKAPMPRLHRYLMSAPGLSGTGLRSCSRIF
ncbi:hypothetical protein C8T65DRAFT_638456 [Cerioporus squamosus]|nr:hypothetical protein C8T65DRAFT_638456 [Cerioporus squamosus]